MRQRVRVGWGGGARGSAPRGERDVRRRWLVAGGSRPPAGCVRGDGALEMRWKEVCVCVQGVCNMALCTLGSVAAAAAANRTQTPAVPHA
jgi:hypothetical protein